MFYGDVYRRTNFEFLSKAYSCFSTFSNPSENVWWYYFENNIHILVISDEFKYPEYFYKRVYFLVDKHSKKLVHTLTEFRNTATVVFFKVFNNIFVKMTHFGYSRGMSFQIHGITKETERVDDDDFPHGNKLVGILYLKAKLAKLIS